MALPRQLLPYVSVVLLDKVGEGGGGARVDRGEQDQGSGAEGAHEPLGVQGLGVATDSVEREKVLQLKFPVLPYVTEVQWNAYSLILFTRTVFF